MESSFEWDDGNSSHLAQHSVRPEEAEEALLDPRRIPAPAYQALGGGRRRAVLGATVNGRLLFVVFTHSGSRVRVITARNATARERHHYQREKS